MKHSILILILLLLSTETLFSATEMASVYQRINPTLTVKKVSDMFFPEAYPGAPSYTIEHGHTETISNASFLITGEPGKKVYIILPNGNIQLTSPLHAGKIFVSHFTANFPSSGNLNPDGEMKLYVGARREAIPARLPAGDYTGNFSVTVIY